jgi:hypothetical protein
VEPLKEWRFGRRAITLIKAYNRYVVGFSRDDDGEISGTGLPLVRCGRARSCWISAGSLCKPRRGYHPPTRSLI